MVMETSTWEHPSPPFWRKEAPPPASRQGGPGQHPQAPQGCIRLVATAKKKAGATDLLALLCEAAGGRVWLAATMLYPGNDRSRLTLRAAMALQATDPLIAGHVVV